ncbi:MAG: protein-L-isoaspartate(D-aspartate) O-methyltransferase [Spirochaetia bacterium]|nr:protein-L-isoaspartate(D-aspartate) O-methyltransferase [Spirochaetia bacterium]
MGLLNRGLSISLAALCLSFAAEVALPAGGQPEKQKAEEPEQPTSTDSAEVSGEMHEERRRMVQQDIAGRGIEDPEVLEAMRRVPRHGFVRKGDRSRAYADKPLPIGQGQTISQPYIVAYMTEMLELKPGDRVLEIGTGSGYQAAVLAEISNDVYSIEIIDELASWAQENLAQNGYSEVKVKQGDGYYGWEQYAPFDAIIVAAAAGHIPPPLLEQLKPDGRMVIPIGGVYEVQTLMLVEKEASGEVRTERLMPVRFVPFTGEAQS